MDNSVPQKDELDTGNDNSMACKARGKTQGSSSWGGGGGKAAFHTSYTKMNRMTAHRNGYRVYMYLIKFRLIITIKCDCVVLHCVNFTVRGLYCILYGGKYINIHTHVIQQHTSDTNHTTKHKS